MVRNVLDRNAPLTRMDRMRFWVARQLLTRNERALLVFAVQEAVKRNKSGNPDGHQALMLWHGTIFTRYMLDKTDIVARALEAQRRWDGQ